MLTAYCRNVLIAELAKPDYDGKTAAEAFAWLTEPVATTRHEPTGVELTPRVAASVIGPLKAEILASRVLTALPSIGPALLAGGVSLGDPETAPFLSSLAGGPLLQGDIDALLALGTRSVAESAPPRMSRRFDPEAWPHLDDDGHAGGPDDPAITGFPNSISRDEFDDAWHSARGA